MTTSTAASIACSQTSSTSRRTQSPVRYSARRLVGTGRSAGSRPRSARRRAEWARVISGPYQFVRHPIYSGILIGVLGTALATNLIGLIIVGVLVGETAGVQRDR
ncbi:MAG: methyltransferase family protein [Solirubrobacteraceae bacterium]